MRQSASDVLEAVRRDFLTTPADGALIAAGIAGAETVTLAAAHLSNIERARDFTRAVSDFLG